MLNTTFGMEIEMTGITREMAAQVTATVIGGTSEWVGGHYDTYQVVGPDGRKWKFMSDSSIETHSARGEYGGRAYSTEFVTPICKYEQDMATIQEIVRALRKNGAFVNDSCGIHIHLGGDGHTAKSIRNFANMVYNRGDLLYSALAIKASRQSYCKKLSINLMEEINKLAPSKATLNDIEEIWYTVYRDYNRSAHYHSSRYHFLNLHSFFNGHGTVELRGFNSTLHAGEIRAYVLLALAMNHQALETPMVKRKMAETSREAMKNWLKQMGVNDKTCIEHLTKHLVASRVAA